MPAQRAAPAADVKHLACTPPGSARPAAELRRQVGAAAAVVEPVRTTEDELAGERTILAQEAGLQLRRHALSLTDPAGNGVFRTCPPPRVRAGRARRRATPAPRRPRVRGVGSPAGRRGTTGASSPTSAPLRRAGPAAIPRSRGSPRCPTPARSCSGRTPTSPSACTLRASTSACTSPSPVGRTPIGAGIHSGSRFRSPTIANTASASAGMRRSASNSAMRTPYPGRARGTRRPTAASFT